MEPFKPLDNEEADLMRSIEAGEWQPVKGVDLENYRKAANVTLRRLGARRSDSGNEGLLDSRSK